MLVATLVGGFGAGWTFLPPLPFFPAGQWPMWSESVFFVGVLLVGSGFFVYCIDVLRQTTSTYGGLTRRARLALPARARAEAPPAPVIAATVVAFDGLLAMSAGATIGLGLLGRTYDSGVGFDLLVVEEPRLLLRPHDREPADLPRRRRRLRAAAPLRRSRRTR